KDKKDKGKKEAKLTDAQKAELKKLAGSWSVISFEREGKKAPPDELKKMKVVQKDSGDWTLTTADESAKGRDTPFPDKNPKEIDSLYLDGDAKDKVAKGIYKIDGDTVTFCFGEPGKDRPKEFKAAADSGATLWVLKRMKEEDKDKDKKDKDKDKKD